MRIYINTGTLNASISSPGTTTPAYSLTVANNSFNNTCQFSINHLNATPPKGGISLTAANITAALYISKVPI